jgi:acetate kinase
MKILTLNCWSHTIKYHLFSRGEATALASGTVERVALGSSFIRQQVPGRTPYCLETECVGHSNAIALIIATLTDPQQGVMAEAGEIAAVAHRVAHGGEAFCHSVEIDEQVLDAIRDLQHLAPQHSGPNIAGIEAAREHLPVIPHVAIFDTAFHLSLPEAAYRYPLPHEWYEQYGVRRYGFHGPSHLYLSRRAAVLLDKPAADCNLITIHIDRGVSLCAIKNGLSIDTSMGMTPLEGALMETRCGDIDPGIHAYMMQEMELSAQEMEQILNHKSGIAGITGQRKGRQQFLEAVLDGDPRCRLALEIETYRMRKYIGAYLAVIGPLDGLVFTTGTGAAEWIVREKVLQGLESFGIRFDRDKNRAVRGEQGEAEISSAGSPVRTFVMPTDEELVFVEDTVAICAGSYSDHQRHDYSFARRCYAASAPAAHGHSPAAAGLGVQLTTR